MIEIKLYKSKKKALKLFFLSIPFIVIGIWMITRAESSETYRIMGWIGTCFFGLAIPVGLFHLFDKRPQVIINEIGIYDRTTHSEFINWEIIKDAYSINIYGQHFICLLVPGNFRPSKKKSKFYKGIAKLNEELGAQELNIQLGQLEMDTIKLTEFIIAMTHAEKSKKAELIKTLPNTI
ncbi:STM3941 family protein [uncultured Tenacibaculum sp.]|uniref:STM3941 family protein n=1 Tax=uncultured Tenacibaculum sp. TaxID=174713 RepID=UPI00263377F3|nr:STM3941 family protein [uncultured Tenacibaculum sp.]